jgi:hypothetical protein
MEKDVNEMIADLYKIGNDVPRLSQKVIKDHAVSKMESFVGTKAEYDARLALTIVEIENEDKRNRDKVCQDHQNAWTKIQRVVESEEGVVGHPKLNKAWNIAWEDGHSSGYYDVVNAFRKLADLLRD